MRRDGTPKGSQQEMATIHDGGEDVAPAPLDPALLVTSAAAQTPVQSPTDTTALTGATREAATETNPEHPLTRYANLFGGVDWAIDDAIGVINVTLHSLISPQNQHHAASMAANIVSATATAAMITVPGLILGVQDLREQYGNYMAGTEVDRLKVLTATCGILATSAMFANPAFAAGGYATASSAAGITGNALAMIQNVLKLTEICQNNKDATELTPADRSYVAQISDALCALGDAAREDKGSAAAACGQLLSGFANVGAATNFNPAHAADIASVTGFTLIFGSAVFGCLERQGCFEKPEANNVEEAAGVAVGRGRAAAPTAQVMY